MNFMHLFKTGFVIFVFFQTSPLWSQGSRLQEFNATEISTPLINPYSGLVNYGIESCYGGYLRKIPDYIAPESLVYLRPVWGDLEPEEGRLDLAEFERIRDRHLEGGAKQWAFRIVPVMPNEVFKHATPDWVREAGAEGTWLSSGGWEPQYGDSIYVLKFGNFIQKMADKYDGDPTLAFVDISSLGYYGEWGDPGTGQKGWEDPEVEKKETQALVDIFLKAFKRTPLAISTHIIGLNGEDRYSVQYALDHGVWNRRDGVGSPFFHKGHKRLVEQTWEDRPVITEWYGIYSNYNDKTTGENRNWSGWSFADAVDQALDQHGLFAEMSRDLDLTDAVLKHPAFELLAQKIGYRLVLSKASFPEALEAGQKLIIRQIWKNQGVAKLYVKYPLRIYLTDRNGKDIWTAIDNDFDPTDWKRGDMYEVHSSFKLSENFPPGRYDIKVALVDPEGRPAIALGMEGDRGDRKYSIGQLNVTGKHGPDRYIQPEILLNLARSADAVGHVAVVDQNRPFHYPAPINDGLMRLSVSDAPGDLSSKRQAYGIVWEKEKTFNTLKYYAGETKKGKGGWFERDLWVEILKDGKWVKLDLVAWDPVYPFDDRAGNQVYTISFNTVEAKGIRLGGFAGRRYSKWVSIREIEVFRF